jgi:hypothetical protein
MHPSNVMQNGKSLALVLCDITYDTATEAQDCPLLRLTLKCTLGMNNIFDYQGTLYENENSLDKIGTTL